MSPRRHAAIFLLTCLAAVAAGAVEPLKIQLVLKAHRFSPSEIHVPAGTPVILEIVNSDPTDEEFDSPALKVEKVIPGGGKAKVRLRPLAPGRFPFEGEYNSDTAMGVVIAEEKPNAASPAQPQP